MKNRFAATLLFLASFMAVPLFSESKAQKIESLVQEAAPKKIKNMLIKNQSLAAASYGESKDSLLIVALKSKREYDVIKLLLDAGVDPKMQNAEGDNAIVYAAKCGADSKILDELISYDTVLPFQRKNRILKKNNLGKSAMDYAVENGDQEQIDIINRYLGIMDVAESPSQDEQKPEEAAKDEKRRNRRPKRHGRLATGRSSRSPARGHPLQKSLSF